VESPWTDLDRPPLSQRRLEAALCGTGLWREIRVVASTVSTNADVAGEARAGAAQGLVVLAEQQQGGRGRLDRTWESPARAGILMSALLRPAVPLPALSLVPLVAGVAVAEALREVGQVDATLKWPNDVLVDGRKVAGLLVERVSGSSAPPAVVVGIGVNVSTRPLELATPNATSVAMEGGPADREPLVKDVLRALEQRLAAWSAAGGASAPVLLPYRAMCETIGHRVVLHLPGRDPVEGVAVAVDDTGRLVIRSDDGRQQAWSAGDIVHVRAEG
jgi:BirA family biotin operon repressor/biotin-[acetyl-CoA-carboxylase] ligase